MISKFKMGSTLRFCIGMLVALILPAAQLAGAQAETNSNETVSTGLAPAMPEVKEMPAGNLAPKLLAAQKGQVITSNVGLTPMLPIPELMSGTDPFKIIVDEKIGELIYTFDEGSSKSLKGLTAENGVVFTSTGTTITCRLLSYTAATDTMDAEGPGLIVELSSLTYHADKLTYHPKAQVMDFQGNVVAIQKDKDGRVTTTW